MSGLDVRIERPQSQECFELVAVRGAVPPALGRDGPANPGAVRRAPSGRLDALHFAPGRWLLFDVPADLNARLAAQSEATLVDVAGKWQRRCLRGADVWRLLAAGADVASMLAGRECAALALFDCPVVVAREGEGVDLWVQASYAGFLDAQLERACARLIGASFQESVESRWKA